MHGDDLDKGIGVPGAHIHGAHLLLPGWTEESPTLEMFAYDEPAEDCRKAVNRPGFAHINFMVDDVAKARQEVLANGGSALGEIMTTSGGLIWCYVTDPEGNILELQAWA